jgi:hypothetical protein
MIEPIPVVGQRIPELEYQPGPVVNNFFKLFTTHTSSEEDAYVIL